MHETSSHRKYEGKEDTRNKNEEETFSQCMGFHLGDYRKFHKPKKGGFKMKKKISLVNLNKNEVKKNGMKELLKEELGTLKGGFKCFFWPCYCWCSRPENMFSIDDENRIGNTNQLDFVDPPLI